MRQSEIEGDEDNYSTWTRVLKVYEEKRMIFTVHKWEQMILGFTLFW